MEKTYDSFDVVFIEIYNKNINYLVKYLNLLVYDLNYAEDLAHDIFLRIYKSKNIEITGVKFRNYIKKAARNIAIDHLKKLEREEAKKKKVIPELKEFDESFYSNLENGIIHGDVMCTVRDVLENYSERNRKIFISRILQNKTLKQVSEDQNISSYIIKRVENEILQQLREKLKQYF